MVEPSVAEQSQYLKNLVWRPHLSQRCPPRFTTPSFGRRRRYEDLNVRVNFGHFAEDAKGKDFAADTDTKTVKETTSESASNKQESTLPQPKTAQEIANEQSAAQVLRRSALC